MCTVSFGGTQGGVHAAPVVLTHVVTDALISGLSFGAVRLLQTQLQRPLCVNFKSASVCVCTPTNVGAMKGRQSR